MPVASNVNKNVESRLDCVSATTRSSAIKLSNVKNWGGGREKEKEQVGEREREKRGGKERGREGQGEGETSPSLFDQGYHLAQFPTCKL